ncbi:MAG TPA: glutaredoxin [Erysipelotrichaceae bacterium]|nr:glutaredoxin [Erysipelotrichaceae bacterium]
MFKIYGSEMCPDCRECRANFDAYGIQYEVIDINESLANLKAFLKLRDHDSVFDPCRENNSIGLPAIVREDGTVFLDWEGYLEKEGLTVMHISDGQACSIDRKGC